MCGIRVGTRLTRERGVMCDWRRERNQRMKLKGEEEGGRTGRHDSSALLMQRRFVEDGGVTNEMCEQQPPVQAKK